jgi:hypothetical protein
VARSYGLVNFTFSFSKRTHVFHYRPPDIETAKALRYSQVRVRTLTPPLDPASVRGLTPEPTGSHWIFSKAIQLVLVLRSIPFIVTGIRNSDQNSKHVYEGDPARTVLEDHCKSSPQEGEVIVNVVHRHRLGEISINPRYLIPWVPVVGCEVVVIKGVLLGAIGKAKECKEKDWVVTFSVDDDSYDFVIQESELASVEAHQLK